MVKVLVAWMDAKGRKNWEVVKSKKALRELRSISCTIDGERIAIEYVAEITSTTYMPKAHKEAMTYLKSNPTEPCTEEK